MPGHDQPLGAAGHASGFDEKHVAAHRSPRQAHGYSGAACAVGHFGVGAIARGAQVLFHCLWGHADFFAHALGDAPGLLAAERADLLLEVAHARLASVAADDEAHGFFVEMDACSSVEAVLLGLPRDQVAEGDDGLLVLRVAFERDDLHAVAQRVRHRVEHIGGGDEEDLRQVERHVQVVVAEGGILLGIEHFEQRRGRVAAEVAPQLVHFVEHEYRVVGPHPPQGLDDLSGQRPDVGPAVAADFRFVVHAPHRDARELAAQRPRDGLAERRLPHARRSHEAQDGALQNRPELQHGQVVENPVLHLFQVVVILVQNLGRPFHVHLRGGGHAPRQAGHPFQVGPRHAVFRRCRRHAPQPAQLAQGFLSHLFGHPGGFEFGAQFVEFALRVVAFAQFLLDGLQLLAQVELPLALGKLPLHLGLNPVAQVEQFQLAREMAVDHGQARLPVGLLQQLLPLDVGERGQVAGREIRQFPRLGDVKRAFRKIVGQVRRRRHDLLEQPDHVLP